MQGGWVIVRFARLAPDAALGDYRDPHRPGDDRRGRGLARRRIEQLLLHPFAMLGSILIAGGMTLILKVALVPSQRHTGWVRSLTGPNGRWFFLVLLLLWGGGMAFLASLGLSRGRTVARRSSASSRACSCSWALSGR